MFNEYDYLGHLEMADAADLSQMVLSPSADEERTLRKYLGNRLYQRLHSLAVRSEMSSAERDAHKRGNVILIPGILGSQLTSEDINGQREHIWLNPRHIIAGHLTRLKLDESGRGQADPAYKVTATGILKRYYGELILTLAEYWHVRLFAYDWRKDFKTAAAELHAALTHFPNDEPVHIVAHSTGGIIARWYIHQYPERWNVTAKTVRKNGPTQARLIMLGTPNYGLYPAPLALAGQLPLIHWTDMLDAQHDHDSFRSVINSFPSVYQLIPAPTKLKKKALRETLYRPESYGDTAAISSVHLAQAQADHETLTATESTIDPKRMLYIAGDNQPTYVALTDPSKLMKLAEEYNPLEFFTKNHKLNQLAQQSQAYASSIYKVFTISSAGDGSVSHELGVLPTVPTLYAEDSHAGLLTNPGVLMALQDLLLKPFTPEVLADISYTHGLQTTIPARREESLLDPQAANQMLETSWHNDRKRLAAVVRRVHFRSNKPLDRGNFAEEEQALRDTLARGFLYGRNREDNSLPFTIDIEPRPIRIHLYNGDLLNIDEMREAAATPIDAIALGHYLDSRPHGLLRQLDQAISRYQQIDGHDQGSATSPLAEEDLLLHQYTQRGIIRGDLAQPFFLRDPRPTPSDIERVIAIAGMGTPGRFNEPELMILARELCWSLGRMGKKHLATVLIGAGRDNLPIPIAISGWIRGLKHALTGAKYWLKDLTFVIHDPEKLIEVDQVLRREIAVLQQTKRMRIDYKGLDEWQIAQLRDSAHLMMMKVRANEPTAEAAERASTRIAVTLNGNKYRFGAITTTASIPEREIYLDPNLVNQANRELSIEGDPKRQVQLGQFMEKLLIPEDLRDSLYSDAPLVMMVDSTTARIHWELLAQSDNARRPSQSNTKASAADDLQYQYWGTSRGFTRQLRTGFALPPEPPPPVERILRVLVVADPAADAPLIGAEEEGIYVAELFERFNTLYHATKNRIEVIRLFGPREATRTAVMRHLMLHTYDLLHFCGHCIYDAKEPSNSGWLFSNGERLSAYEFTRIDRIPKFVFSNACETGILQEQKGSHSSELAPSLAEAFFARGVSNFICTAWPVDDRAARDFALTLYASLLGISSINGDLNRQENYVKSPSRPIYEAIREARLAVANPSNDIRMWGAYQHYGNPYFRLFQPESYTDDQAHTSPISQRQEAGNGTASTVANKEDTAESKTNQADEILVFFNGVDGATGARSQPVPLSALASQVAQRATAGLPPESLFRAVRKKRGLPLDLLKQIDQIETVGWGILYHKEEDPEVLKALRPLIDHRSAQIKNPAIVHELTYGEHGAAQSVAHWLDQHGLAIGSMDPTKVPFYLLIIGSPERIPFAFGHLLDLQYAVGRLHFATAAEYARYANSVITYERGEIHNRKEMLFFAPFDETDRAIKASATQLVNPLIASFGTQSGGIATSAGFQTKALLGKDATKAALHQLLVPESPTIEPPALLFSATHGAEWKLADERQLTTQGALVCQRNGKDHPLRPEEYFSAADLPDEAQVHGLITFFFACYGAGTPTHYRYLDNKQVTQKKRNPPRLAASPFIAALPQRLLAHPNGGALACIGHVDKVFTTSFMSQGREPRLDAFRSGLTGLLAGKPVGLALMDFNDRFAMKSAELSGRIDAGEAALSDKMIYDWLIRNDAEGYLLLGDPAVCLKPEQMTAVE